MEDSGFERIIDDEDTGDMFKDAYMQEAIFDKVRAVEFDMESAATAEVGSLLDSVSDDAERFRAHRRRGRRTARPQKSKKPDAEVAAAETRKKPPARARMDRTDGNAAETIRNAKPNRSKIDRKKRRPRKIEADKDGRQCGEIGEAAEQTERKPETEPNEKSRRQKRTRKDASETPADAEASVKESESTRRKWRSRRGGRGSARAVTSEPVTGDGPASDERPHR